jgi:hypothetical protein
MNMSPLNGLYDQSAIMSGTWYNPKTGDNFTVKDVFLEDNNMIVMTTDGRRLDYNIVSNYVKSDKPIPKIENQQVKPAADGKQINTSIPNAAEELLLPEDMNLGIKSEQRVTVATSQEADEDTIMVNRLLKKGGEPTFEPKIEWTKFPQKQLEMLIDYMDVDLDKICEYYINKISLSDLKCALSKQIKDYISSKFSVVQEDEVLLNEEPIKEKTEKVTIKPTKEISKKAKKK